MGRKLLNTDPISGHRGVAFAVINGEKYELFMAKNIEASVEFDKNEFRAMGLEQMLHRSDGYTASGSMTLYYVTSKFRKMAIETMKTGKLVYFDLLITNEDVGSSRGRQTTALYNCSFDSAVLAKLDIDSSELDEDIDFTYETAEILEEFNED